MRWMMKLFGEESAFGRFLNRLYVIVVANLLFVLFSLPAVTIGASLSALDYTLMKYQRGDKHFKVAAMFWKGLKESFAKATLFFAAYVLLMLTQALEIYWCRQFPAPVSFFRYALLGLMVLETILAVYMFPVIAAFNGGMGELVKNAVFFAFSRPLRMLLCVALNVLPLVATYAFLQYLPLWAFLWMLCGFALIAYGTTHVMLPVFMPFLPEVDICGDIIRPDQRDDPNLMVGEDDSGDDMDEKTLQEMLKYGL